MYVDNDISSDMDISVDSEDDEGQNELVLVHVNEDATMVEVFVDDFMVLTNNINPEKLVSRFKGDATRNTLCIPAPWNYEASRRRHGLHQEDK